MDEFNERKGERVPGASSHSNALRRESGFEIGQKVHCDGAGELFSLVTTDSATKELVGFAHVAHDNRESERAQCIKGPPTKVRVRSRAAAGDAEHNR